MYKLQLQLFILLAVGYYVGKKNILDASARDKLTSLIMKIILPSSIILSFQMELTAEMLLETMEVLLVAVAIQVLYLILNSFLWKKLPEDEAISCKYGTMVTNASFVGLPIATALYGSEGLLYASIFVLPQRIMMWAYGLPLYTGKSEKHMARKILLHPCVASIFIGIFLMIFYNRGYPLPEVAASAMKSLSECTTALCMVVIGGVMSEMKPREFFNIHALYFCVWRLILIPIFVLALLKRCPMSEVCRGVSVLLTGLPTPTTVVILAQQYDRKPKFASQMMFLSTLGSMLTLPLVIGLL